MIKAEESSSMYDFVPSSHQAPQATEKPVREGDNYIPKAPVAEQKAPLVREVNWQSAEKVNERYKDSLPDHVKESMTVTQKDFSYYAFQRFIFRHPPRDNFESQINIAHKERFGVMASGFVFQEERDKYIKFYRSMM
jgi:hypothetical protein